MTKQAGKTHNYPSNRKSYTSSRKAVGGRKLAQTLKTNINKQTYFDRLKEKCRQSGGMYAMKSIMCIYYYLLARVWIDI